jgi:predicted enzyme related to lactoylglutathione lyase
MTGPQATPEPTASGATVPLRFEVTVIPVSGVDRAKDFYWGLGWRLDADFPVSETYRVVQFTPPGSPASIQFGTGMTDLAPGSITDLFLAVDDLDAAREELTRLGDWYPRANGAWMRTKVTPLEPHPDDPTHGPACPPVLMSI